MPIRDLRDKYGDGKGREVVNRAVRAELPGGAEALDAVGLLYEAFRQADLHDRPWKNAADKAHVRAVKLADAMREEIAERYGLNSRRETPGSASITTGR